MSVFRLKPSKETIKKNKLIKLKELKKNVYLKERQLYRKSRSQKKTDADYSDTTRQTKMVQTQMIPFLKSKLRGNTDQDEIDFINLAIVNAEIELISADLDGIKDIIDQYDIDEEDDTISGNWSNFTPEINKLTELAQTKYMPIFKGKLAALIKKYPANKKYIEDEVSIFESYFSN